MSDPDSFNPSLRPPAAEPGRGREPQLPHIDVFERGAPIDGVPQTLNERLFMQLLVFHVREDVALPALLETLSGALAEAGIGAVVYEDVNDPRGVAVLSYSQDAGDFVTRLRPALASESLAALTLRPEFTMLGRTYSSGYEQDLSHWILDRPRQTVQHAGWDWAVWYPLRRSGAFELLSGREKGEILREHATIGRAYGGADLAHDVRLACHGLDTNDNEFVIGLVGKSLHPLSHVVQTMRGTKQTSTYIAQMGPFFVGRVRARHPLPGDLAPSSEG
ncbi:MAG: chlorite dismutase family protein [Myxococcales bacterium]|nr:chlorite dismutase family protein [Myxococcales bacterium]